jgi:hypothetical protein
VVSALQAVLGAVRDGVAVDRLGAHLGMDDGLVEMALEHWRDLEVITPACSLLACQPGSAPACRRCPLAQGSAAGA